MKKLLLLMVVLGSVVAIPALAAPIIGDLNITGSVQVGATTIDWFPYDDPVVGGSTSGTFTVDPSSTGDFASVIGSTGTSLDLDVTSQPVGTPFSLPNFLTVGPYSFTLTFINPGVFSSASCGAPAAAGQTCTPNFPPPKSPFNLTNLTSSSSSASFSVMGTVTRNGTDVTNFTGLFTTQFPTQSFQDLLAIVSGGGKVPSSYSASFTAQAIPEPATASLMVGGALLLIAGLLKRKSGAA